MGYSIDMGTLVEKSGNLFHSGISVIGHGINVDGKMGAGIAKGFADLYPDMRDEYVVLCRQNKIAPGTAWVWHDPTSDDIVLNVASQDRTGRHARLSWVKSSVTDAIEQIRETNPDTTVIGLPRIGCGIGGLVWDDVREVLSDIAESEDINIEIWFPLDTP